MKLNKKTFLLFVLVLVIIIVTLITQQFSKSTPKQSAATSSDSNTVEEELVNQANQASGNSSIQVESLTKGDSVTSPLIITGKARGNWYFEGSFPVVLSDENGKTLAHGTAKAQGEWMTEDFVPFKTELTFTKPAKNSKGTLIFKKDNPSGLPENDQSFEVTVNFK
jgi:hypothetical protein